MQPRVVSADHPPLRRILSFLATLALLGSVMGCGGSTPEAEEGTGETTGSEAAVGPGAGTGGGTALPRAGGGGVPAFADIAGGAAACGLIASLC